MAQMKKEIIENGIHYTFHGDYYFPALEFAETPQQGIGRYGRMRKSYLEKHRPGLYERLILSVPAALIGWTVWSDKWQMLKASAKR